MNRMVLFGICFCCLIPAFVFSQKEIDLKLFERKIYSQNGEDGILIKIFDCIKPKSHYFVEFGVQDGLECNSRYLREKLNWRGLTMDGEFENPKIGLRKHFVTRDNITTLFQQYGVPREFDLLSIDIDGNDWYLWEAILQEYSPRVVVIEYNPNFPPPDDRVIPYDPEFFWGKIPHAAFHGASATAIYNLARAYNYSLVYIEKNGVNMFFVRDDLLNAFSLHFTNTNKLDSLFHLRRYQEDISKVYEYDWITSEKLLHGQ